MCLITTTTYRCGHRIKTLTRTGLKCSITNFHLNGFAMSAIDHNECKSCAEETAAKVKVMKLNRVIEWLEGLEEAETPEPTPITNFV